MVIKINPLFKYFSDLRAILCVDGFLFLFFVSFDEDHKKVIGILLKAMALFKLSMNENKTQNDAK